jgi:hypothetical protein
MKILFWIYLFSSSIAAQTLIDPARRTTWQPGVTYNGGIPARNQPGDICTTLSPLGGTLDDTPQIPGRAQRLPRLSGRRFARPAHLTSPSRRPLRRLARHRRGPGSEPSAQRPPAAPFTGVTPAGVSHV